MENTLIRDGFSHLRAFKSRLLGVSLPLLHPEETKYCCTRQSYSSYNQASPWGRRDT